jgi:hypothetical protein
MGAAIRLGRRLCASLGLALAALTSGVACGTDAIGLDACKQIEDARCHAAAACGVPLEPPYSTSGTDVDACIRFYDVACLHGLAIGSDPGPTAVRLCVAAIDDHPCPAHGPNLVQSPQNDPACAWLIPPALSTAVTEASTPDAAGAEASAE